MSKQAFLSAVAVCGLSLVLGAGCASDDATKLTPTGPGGEPISSVMPERDKLGEKILNHPLQSQTIYFEYDSAQIRDSETAKIQTAAKYLIENGAIKAEMEGHCDERGSTEYNLSLGERRAQAVRAKLAGMGIDGSRLYTKSYGKEKPVEAGHDESAWSKNRRVEFALYK